MLHHLHARRVCAPRLLPPCALIFTLLVTLLVTLPPGAARAEGGSPAAPAAPAVGDAIFQTHLTGPPGSGDFGWRVAVLPNGNFVVADPSYSEGGKQYVGAVYLYDGATLELISTLKGSAADDHVGVGFQNSGLLVLANGNFVVASYDWNGERGAVTWGSAATGFGAPVVTVSAANSLVGGTAGDSVGIRGIALANGNFVVGSDEWDNGTAQDAGAVTWAGGLGGTVGAVSPFNSLVGSSAGDGVGSLYALPNGHYLVRSASWDNGPAADAGAVTWGSGLGGTVGPVSAANSLVGSSAGDRLGVDGSGGGIHLLANGNYLVASPTWDRGPLADAGAVTWGSGASGVAGPISALNSLVGSAAGDALGAVGRVALLPNGNYVVHSYAWDRGAAVDAGAAAWGNGATGRTGEITFLNSLVGFKANDRVGYGVTALANGNYVVTSSDWNGGCGAATWGNGASGAIGFVTAANSLVCQSAGDQVGYGSVTALTNGNYVVGSPRWDNGGAADAGAATWAGGDGGTVGAVTAANSLVGTTADDRLGQPGGVTALTNGDYVVASLYWDNGPVADAGAAAWADGGGGTMGALSPANSLVGSAAGDYVGIRVKPLPNGAYVVASPQWDNGSAADAGAATLGGGTGGTVGPVSAANSLVGTQAGDAVGEGVWPLASGAYLVVSPQWDNGGAADAGAVTWGSGAGGTVGPVSPANSLVGSAAGDAVGSTGVLVLANGNYVAASAEWDNGSVADAGAATWGSGASGVAGPISAANSLVGTQADDHVGFMEELPNGDYAVRATGWHNGAMVNAGAVTPGNGLTGTRGEIGPANSVLGAKLGSGPQMRVFYNAAHGYLLVSRRTESIVTVVHPALWPVYLPLVGK